MSKTNMTAEQKGWLAAIAPSEKPTFVALLISTLFGLLTLLIPLCPVTVDVQPNQPVLYNMIGAVNQTVGSDATREEAFAPLLLYYVAVVLLAVGCMGYLYRLKSAALFNLASSVLFLAFASVWKNADLPPTDMVVKAFTQSALPYVIIICAVGMLVGALISLLLSTDEMKKLRKS